MPDTLYNESRIIELLVHYKALQLNTLNSSVAEWACSELTTFLIKKKVYFEVGHNIYSRIFCEALLNSFYFKKDHALFFVGNARVIQDRRNISQRDTQKSRQASLLPLFFPFPPGIFLDFHSPHIPPLSHRVPASCLVSR